MSKTMLIDAAHAEETRVAIVDGRQIEEFDFESTARRQLRGNIYLAKVTRVEPSLQAAFVEYGGNRHGFLAFNEIHPDYYQIPVADREAIMAEADDDGDEHLDRESADDEAEGGPAEEERLKRRLMRRYKIQDVIKRRQILLVQVVKDERGAKGAALTTWLSLAGRYCVLMPNTGKGGGISRKITQATDRKRLKAAAASLEVPRGMGLIIRTAGAKRTKAEIKRDYDYLLRLWETIRETTLKSNAPSMIYEEENLVRRAVRDMFDKDFDGIQVDGEQGWREARDFMRVLMPSQAKKVHLYRGATPLFASHKIEELLNQIHQPVVPLKSGGYLVINQTEALVAIDVNSGRATKERGIEQTALKTNLEAAAEAARQLRLRDLAGLIVIDFIDMDEGKNNRAVEKVLKDALAGDRARIQMGRISEFGLMEISRQRRRLGVIEGATEVCQHCQGAGRIRSAESAALTTLRAVDIEAGKNGAGCIVLRVSTAVAMFILNHKRDYLQRLQARKGLKVIVQIDDSLAQAEHVIERTETDEEFVAPEAFQDLPADDFDDVVDEAEEDEDEDEAVEAEGEGSAGEDEDQDRGGRRGRGRRRRRGGREDETKTSEAAEDDSEAASTDDVEARDDDDEDGGRRRRRGRRGGRRVREDVARERDPYGWVRARTPSLDDPYVWFDPLDPQGSVSPTRVEAAPADGESISGVQAEDRGEGGGRSRRRRRGRGRGRDRQTDEDIDQAPLDHDTKVETRAVAEGMPAEALPADRPIAVETGEAEAPRRRRVRRKPAAETAPVDTADAVELDVTPAEAEAERDAEAVAPAPQTSPQAAPVTAEAEGETATDTAEAVALVEHAPARKPELDVSTLIQDDPHQITEAPKKAKRGWWRR
ncbi:Rne/Rng family ribonuclease [Brevundimonas lutea]|uniref:Rne/Rng family ribonuclease n=1 Tax=Brevundimonas lutea TaxID=2293980 RepID=UPI000F0398ED|nr:ribonuclease E/G [Brevundimonas lutea]